MDEQAAQIRRELADRKTYLEEIAIVSGRSSKIMQELICLLIIGAEFYGNVVISLSLTDKPQSNQRTRFLSRRSLVEIQ